MGCAGLTVCLDFFLSTPVSRQVDGLDVLSQCCPRLSCRVPVAFHLSSLWFLQALPGLEPSEVKKPMGSI